MGDHAGATRPVDHLQHNLERRVIDVELGVGPTTATATAANRQFRLVR